MSVCASKDEECPPLHPLSRSPPPVVLHSHLTSEGVPGSARSAKGRVAGALRTALAGSGLLCGGLLSGRLLCAVLLRGMLLGMLLCMLLGGVLLSSGLLGSRLLAGGLGRFLWRGGGLLAWRGGFQFAALNDGA